MAEPAMQTMALETYRGRVRVAKQSTRSAIDVLHRIAVDGVVGDELRDLIGTLALAEQAFNRADEILAGVTTNPKGA